MVKPIWGMCAKLAMRGISLVCVAAQLSPRIILSIIDFQSTGNIHSHTRGTYLIRGILHKNQW